ncbi:MAG: ribonuclease P protein component [Candidatus Gottesmanbacteria bacterium]|nr:ribonuclease P protein component [Candidatus Gottesmanbacteria bacterium]
MLPKHHRLPSPEIKSVMRGGKRLNGDGISLIYRKRESTSAFLNAGSRLKGRDDIRENTRFAFVVPVSVDKRAVGRNRLKRLVRESVRLALPSLSPGWDGVFIVRKGLGDEFRVVDGRVREVLRKTGIFKG